MDGIINVYKEKGFTSHDVVARLRGILHQKKIGHTGTLDPEAVGVLPVCLGKATKVCDLLTNKDKTYRAVCRLGVSTDTQDMTGEILEKGDFSKVTQERLTEVLEGFVGDQLQVPPMYSALKVNGKKLYELAVRERRWRESPGLSGFIPSIWWSIDRQRDCLPWMLRALRAHISGRCVMISERSLAVLEPWNCCRGQEWGFLRWKMP